MRMADCHDDRKHYGRGMCKSCYQSWRGNRPVKNPIPPGSTQAGMATSFTEGANHQRVRKARGVACKHECFFCLIKKAYDWAKIHECDGTLPIHYVPSCRRCHMEYDGHFNRELMSKRWVDPDYRARMIEAVVASNKRRGGGNL